MNQDEKPNGVEVTALDREVASKSIGAMEFTDDAKGEVHAVVYTLGVVDRDGDVLLPETFRGESKVKLSHYGHSSIVAQAKGTGAPVEPPVGKGVVRVNSANELEFHGKYFMSTSRGRDAYFTAKEMGPEQEWSVTFWRDKGEKPDSEWEAKGARRLWRNPIDPFEVSPVTVAGGLGTRTVGVKAAEDAAAAQSAEDADESAAAAEQAKLEAQAAAQKVTEEAAKIEADRLEKERIAADESEAREAEIKAKAAEVMEDFHRVQRSIHRMGLR